MTDKLDIKTQDKPYYSGKTGQWHEITIPDLQFLRIDGQGAPGGHTYARAMAALYPLAYGVKFASKAKGCDFVVPPQQSLWWADDPEAFERGDRDAWKWGAMIRLPVAISADDLDDVRRNVRNKLAKKKAGTDALAEVHLISMREGVCLQTLHRGPYRDEAPVLAHLHNTLMPNAGLTFNGPHHEIYLSDPRRVVPEKLRTVLRQPVKSSGDTTG